MDDDPHSADATSATDTPGEAYALVAFEDFYRAHRDRIMRSLALTLGDADLAAEAADEAMMRAYARWETVSSMANPPGWVYRVGLNWARSLLRRLRRGAPTWEPIDVAEPVVVEPALVAALGRLSIRHRSVVVCRYLLGYSDAETSETLGLRPGTTRSCLHRALHRLADDLDHLREW